MDFKSLRYVLAVVEHSNLTEAARSLGISQPSLSKFLQNIENNLGLQLFERVEGRLQPTDAGERYIYYARQILVLTEELGDLRKSDTAQQYQYLHVIAPPFEGSYIHPFAVMQLYKETYNLKLIITETDDSIPMLLSGEADFAISNKKIVHRELQYELLYKDEILLTTSSHHKIAKNAVFKEGCKYPWIDIQELEGEPMIQLSPNQSTSILSNALLESEGISPIMIMQTCNTQAAIRAASAGIGICFTPETGIRNIRFPEPTQFFSIGEPLCADIYIVWNKSLRLSEKARYFISLIQSFL